MPDLGVGTVAMGSEYAKWSLTMLSSLRDRGRYRGPVYVITDQPALFTAAHNIVVVAVPPTHRLLIAKSCKQLLVRYVEEPRFLYLDADIVVTSPLVEWYEQMARHLPRAPLLCYADTKPCEGAYHGGVFLLDVKRGRPIMNRWHTAVVVGQWGSDQACLYSVAGADGPGHLPDNGMEFLRDVMRTGHTRVCLVHVTKGLIEERGEKEISDFLRDELGVLRLPFQ